MFSGGRSIKHLVILSHGFRPFFLLGAIWAGFAIPLWAIAFSGQAQMLGAIHSLDWHRHEMLFGYVGAIVAGFLLTAIPNWTGRPILTGRPLAFLVLLWLGARIGMIISDVIGLFPGLILEMLFFAILSAWSLRQILKAGNRNYPVPALIFLLGLSAMLDYLQIFGFSELTGMGYRLGLTVIILLLSLIGGRIVPAFTRNWLQKARPGAQLPPVADKLDRVTIGGTAVAMIWWSLAPSHFAGGILLLIASVLQFIRLARWRGWSTTAEPLVTILHLSYAWIPIGLNLLGLSLLSAAVPFSAAIHALTVGAIGTMTLAVMTRASLGHSGRPLAAGFREYVIYGCVHCAAIIRVASPFLTNVYLDLLLVSSIIWCMGFLVFAFAYAPMLILPEPNPDTRPTD